MPFLFSLTFFLWSFAQIVSFSLCFLSIVLLPSILALAPYTQPRPFSPPSHFAVSSICFSPRPPLGFGTSNDKRPRLSLRVCAFFLLHFMSFCRLSLSPGVLVSYTTPGDLATEIVESQPAACELIYQREIDERWGPPNGHDMRRMIGRSSSISRLALPSMDLSVSIAIADRDTGVSTRLHTFGRQEKGKKSESECKSDSLQVETEPCPHLITPSPTPWSSSARQTTWPGEAPAGSTGEHHPGR